MLHGDLDLLSPFRGDVLDGCCWLPGNCAYLAPNITPFTVKSNGQEPINQWDCLKPHIRGYILNGQNH